MSKEKRQREVPSPGCRHAAAGSPQCYDRPTPETDAFMLLLEDSEIDLSLVEAKMKDMECERDHAREIAKQACELLAENNFEVNYPPMPWDEGSPENTEPSREGGQSKP